MENKEEIHHYAQIALQQIEDLYKTLDNIISLSDFRSYAYDAAQESRTAIGMLKMKIGVVSDLTESLTI